MGNEKSELLHGTLELLILKLLEGRPQNGYAIGRRIEDLTDDALRVEEGSLYPALYRMVRKGWLKANWGASENNRRAKFYRLTTAGRKRLVAESSNWADFTAAVGKIMNSA
jgi:PadR family transcriptional regulator